MKAESFRIPTLYGLLRDRCGLSIAEAARYHGIGEQQVKDMSAGRKRTPSGIVVELRELYATIEAMAEGAIEQIEEIASQIGDAEEIEIGIASDDHEAQSVGLPCVGAHAAVAGLVAAVVETPIKIVPRGATSASAAAADLRDKS